MWRRLRVERWAGGAVHRAVACGVVAAWSPGGTSIPISVNAMAAEDGGDRGSVDLQVSTVRLYPEPIGKSAGLPASDRVGPLHGVRGKS